MFDHTNKKMSFRFDILREMADQKKVEFETADSLFQNELVRVCRIATEKLQNLLGPFDERFSKSKFSNNVKVEYSLKKKRPYLQVLSRNGGNAELVFDEWGAEPGEACLYTRSSTLYINYKTGIDKEPAWGSHSEAIMETWEFATWLICEKKVDQKMIDRVFLEAKLE